MITESAQKIFEIHIEELSSWGHRVHKHNFFEIVYVEEGEGFQCINQHEFAYRAGNIFLLPPLDCHSFKINTLSRFYFIRFTDHYFLKNDGLTNYKAWFDRKSYFSEYFKKQAGVSLADHILKSKLRIVETKLLHTDLSLKEIAYQLNFTDSSHLARSFKKVYGMTTKEFKNSGQVCCA